MRVDIKKIKPNPQNPRIIKDDKFKKLVKSLEEFPDMLEKRPLVCFTDLDGKYVVLGGNMRLKAATEIGLKELPIILADNWTEFQRREFLIKDNVSYGEHDWDALANEFEVNLLIDWGVDIPNFDTDESKESNNKIKLEYKIEVICKSKEEQEQTYNKFIEQNYECKLLMI